ncbi:MAG: transglutaminase family protein, partial [Rubripirellula sp.]
DDPQWNTEAVGLEKRALSNLLLLRLRDQFAPGSLLHYGQGKWYPGESLPRWALSCIWRRDGEPIWDDAKWLADEGKDYGYTDKDADRFVRHLASELGIPSQLTFPVYEDTFHYLWRENRLPVDLDPADPKLKDPNERAMMVRAFTSGLGSVAGYVMPIRRQWWQSQPRWIGGRWPIRSERVFLLPGDSPIGLRLPMETLPFSGGKDQSVYTEPLDPTIQREPLPKKRESSSGHEGSTDLVLGLKEQESNQPFVEEVKIDVGCADTEYRGSEAGEMDVVRTALCVECRHGRLHVFLPPTQRLEDYLDLVNKVEKTCVALQVAVVIEGYSPPSDDRIERFQVTPDPGVIEVNTQPTETWQQLVDLTEKLHHEARRCRLGTDKFDLDGRHSGTGGGNHIVLGGRTPQDSPFLRRPDLLGSMIRFWNNHPSLSYLFSGKFVGPTSQAPR